MLDSVKPEVNRARSRRRSFQSGWFVSASQRVKQSGKVEGDQTPPAPPSPPSPRRRTRILRAAGLIAFGLFLGLVLAEAVVRLFYPLPRGAFVHNPVIEKQSQGIDLFEPDGELGHRLSGGRLVGVYAPRLVTLDEIAAEAKASGKPVLLNIGDSSTSGWASDVVALNPERAARGEPLRMPFHAYKTYSDLLAEAGGYYVINAGTPGYTSLQGALYLKRLLGELDSRGVKVSAVTVYFGNNDSAWNGNIEDKYLMPGSWFRLQIGRVIKQAMARKLVVTRVSPRDYADALADIVRTCQNRGIRVVFVEPVTPRDWPPGLRARVGNPEAQRRLEEEVLAYLADTKGTKVGELLEEARRVYGLGIIAKVDGNLAEAARWFDAARADDFLVPRIKPEFVTALNDVADRYHVPVVRVGESIPILDEAYFRDYCHPVEPANRLLADRIAALAGGQ